MNVARLMYISLHKVHDLAPRGFWRAGLETVTGLASRRTQTHVELH